MFMRFDDLFPWISMQNERALDLNPGYKYLILQFYDHFNFHCNIIGQ